MFCPSYLLDFITVIISDKDSNYEDSHRTLLFILFFLPLAEVKEFPFSVTGCNCSNEGRECTRINNE
jgi:hypothetical protein